MREGHVHVLLVQVLYHTCVAIGDTKSGHHVQFGVVSTWTKRDDASAYIHTHVCVMVVVCMCARVVYVCVTVVVVCVCVCRE